MKVLAVNSSSRAGGESKTELLVSHLVEGMREAGAEVETVNLRRKKVNHCLGCFTCWTKTPGRCCQQDDMTRELFPKFLESDIVVYATPLYHFTVNAAMKAFIERTLPIALPFFEQRADGTIYHPLRQKFPAAVVLSVCGFPQESTFDQLSAYVHYLFGKGLIAEIYRPAAESLMARGEEVKNDILDATRQAGRELVESRKISPETMARIKQPVVDDFRAFAQMGNLYWKTCIAEGVTPKQFVERGLMPRPDSIETFMLILPFGVKAQAVGDARAILQFNFSGEAATMSPPVEGSCYFTIENGTVKATMGTAEKPDLAIETPFEVWVDIMTGKADGQQMFMEGKCRATGDFSLLRVFG
jgi:multimeric flavodoxin WrbA